jgi:hypothetical protein
VPIQAGKETRLKAGFVQITSTSGWEVFNNTNTASLLSGKLPARIALPAGNYNLRTGGQVKPFTVRDDENIQL